MNFVDKMRDMRQETVDSIDHRFKQLQILDADASDISPEEICKRGSRLNDNDDDDDDQWIPTSVHQYISAANPPIIVHCKFCDASIANRHIHIFHFIASINCDRFGWHWTHGYANFDGHIHFPIKC